MEVGLFSATLKRRFSLLKQGASTDSNQSDFGLPVFFSTHSARGRL
jgi:hypothetical protein